MYSQGNEEAYASPELMGAWDSALDDLQDGELLGYLEEMPDSEAVELLGGRFRNWLRRRRANIRKKRQARKARLGAKRYKRRKWFRRAILARFSPTYRMIALARAKHKLRRKLGRRIKQRIARRRAARSQDLAVKKKIQSDTEDKRVRKTSLESMSPQQPLEPELIDQFQQREQVVKEEKKKKKAFPLWLGLAAIPLLLMMSK